MTSRPPYWCPKTMKRRPCWCPKPILWELNSFLMQTHSFVPKICIEAGHVSENTLLALFGPQGNSLGLLYTLANEFALFSQVYSTRNKQVSPPSSPTAALANFLCNLTLRLLQTFSPVTYPSWSIGCPLCEHEFVTFVCLLGAKYQFW